MLFHVRDVNRHFATFKRLHQNGGLDCPLPPIRAHLIRRTQTRRCCRVWQPNKLFRSRLRAPQLQMVVAVCVSGYTKPHILPNMKPWLWLWRKCNAVHAICKRDVVPVHCVSVMAPKFAVRRYKLNLSAWHFVQCLMRPPWLPKPKPSCGRVCRCNGALLNGKRRNVPPTT